MSYTPYNAPILIGLLGDREIASFFSVDADLEAILLFEEALAFSQSELGLIPSDAADAISQAFDNFSPDRYILSKDTEFDGVAIPGLLRQLRLIIDAQYREFLHYGTTSQDVVDTSLALRLKDVSQIIIMRLKRIIEQIDALKKEFGKKQLMGRTRMQAALPITVFSRLTAWEQQLVSDIEQFEKAAEAAAIIQFAGPVGTLDKFFGKGTALRAKIARKLDLIDAERSWHTDRTTIANYAHALTMITGSLGKVGQDIALMAQNELNEISMNSSGGSSAMPHKQNPVKAEALVTLARFNATQISGMHQAMIHEQERSGAAWMLEWMILPQICIAAGASLRNAELLLKSITKIGD